MAHSWTPDENAVGGSGAVDPARYDTHSDDPCEAAGLIRSMMPSNVRVLDVGCGTGSLTAVATAGKGNEVVGIEPDAARAELARNYGFDVFQTELDAEFIRQHGHFDVVILADVLEHVPAPDKLLDSVFEALKPGGKLLISVPNVAHWSVRANLLFGRFEYEDVGIMDSTHLRWFTTRSLTRLLEAHGLKVESMRHSAGATLPVYQRSIFRFLPGRMVRPLVRGASKLLPSLFGCQHVIAAVKPA